MGPRRRKGEERAAVVRRLGAGDRDREGILDQPFDVGLSPAVTAAPTRHDVLDLPVQKVMKVDVLNESGFAFS